MLTKKTDWHKTQEAERLGRMASMTTLVERSRTPLNEKLSNHFRENVPEYLGSFDEDVVEDVLFDLNEYIKEKTGKASSLAFPSWKGTELALVPITENLQLKVLLVDEYYGDGDYEKYISISNFIITDKTTIDDVDVLLDFVKNYLP